MSNQQQPEGYENQATAVPQANYPAFDLGKFWTEQMHLAQTCESDFKNHPLPLARIKKVMKTDEDVKMISAEAPILFAKGCEIFITELTRRAWVHAEENKRRTLQRSDIATAVSKTDMCDFLIDIVPREEAAKSAPYDPQQQQQQPTEYSSYYPPQGAAASVSQYAPQQALNYASYPQLTPEQMQQYQLQLQQFAAQQQQQQQQQHQQQQQQQSSTGKSEQ